MADIDFSEAYEQIKRASKVEITKKARDKAAFDVKLRNMKNDSDVLKEIAKLLFSINQKLEG